jgi:hypothetical protein
MKRTVKPSDRKTHGAGRSRPIGYRGCPTGKVGYLTSSDARRAAKLLRQSGTDDRPNQPLRVYACVECRLTHVGHDRMAAVSIGSVDMAHRPRT